MPPRYAYWTILAGGLPTAFRAAEKDELLPTFHRIKEKHPDAEMKWFARGRLWASPDEAQRHVQDTRRGSAGARAREARGKDWRPGGEHRDPRQPFKDAKKQQNQDWRKRRWELKHRDEAQGTGSRRPSGLPDERPLPRGDRDDRRPGSRLRDRSAPRERPHGDPLRDRQTKGSRQGSDRARGADEKPRSAKPRSSPPPRQDRSDHGSSEKAPRRGRDDRPWSDTPRDESRRRPAGSFPPASDRNTRPPERDRRGSNRPRPSPRPAPHGDTLRDEVPRRPFKPAHGHGRTRPGPGTPKERDQWEERTPPQQPRPPRPEREPRPDAEPGPEPPPHPGEPVVPPPSEPPERGGKS